MSRTYGFLYGGTAVTGAPTTEGSEDGTIFTFADEPVTGSYSVDPNCRGRAIITPKSRSEMHFGLVVVDRGNEMLAIATDAGTVVSGTLGR
jgi:hypothetical protein